MKKILFAAAAISSFLTASTTYALDINITSPAQGYNDLGNFITNFIQLAFALALLLVLVMLIWGAFEWISSGGDKEAVGKARGRIINALIGLAVLAIAFALATLGANFLGFSNLNKIIIPGPVTTCKIDASLNNNGCPIGTTCKPADPKLTTSALACQP